jgi:hypothetical protein
MDSQNSIRRCRPQLAGRGELGQREGGDDDDRREHRDRQRREQVGGDEQQQQDREPRPITPVTCAAGPGLEGHGRPRAARAHREALEEAREDVRRADADHLLVAVDGCPGASGVCRGRRDRVGEGDQRDAEGAGDEQADVCDRDPGAG